MEKMREEKTNCVKQRKEEMDETISQAREGEGKVASAASAVRELKQEGEKGKS